MQILEVVRNPHEGMESAALTDSTVSREEEERHNRLLAENDDLKKQIAEVWLRRNSCLLTLSP